MSTLKSYFCPACKQATTIESRARKDVRTNDLVMYEIGECNNYSQHFLVTKLIPSGQILEIYPHTLPGKVSDDLPPQIKADFEEALLDQSVGAIRSSVTMARRALQGICLHQGAPATRTVTKNNQPKEIKNDLSPQIDWLLKEQIITKPLHAMAHEVRTVGNEGAHPEDAADQLELNPKDASEILALLDAFAQTLYIGPSILQRRIDERQTQTETDQA